MSNSISQSIQTFFSRYCCICCNNCYEKYFQKKKILPEETNLSLSLSHHSKDSSLSLMQPKKEISNHILIKKFVQKWEEKFWPKIWKNYSNNCLKRQAATKIQAIIRGYLGKLAYKRQYLYAINDMNEFWKRKHELRLLEKEKQRIAKLTRQRVGEPLFFFT
jgi:hypothetical protein